MKVKDIIKHELIGLNIEVVDSRNRSNLGIKGKVIDETKFTLVVQNNKKKRLFKKDITIKVQDKVIHGEDLLGRPKERIKK